MDDGHTADWLWQAEDDSARRMVAEQAAHLDRLRSVHRRCRRPVDWAALASGAPPPPPEPEYPHEDAAIQEWIRFEPTWMDRLLGRAAARREERFARIDAARRLDEAENERRRQAHEQGVGAWYALQALARDVLARRPRAWREALHRYRPFEALRILGTRVAWAVTDDGQVFVDLVSHGPAVIPRRRKRLTSLGRLVVRPVPDELFHQDYQDYVCSAVLRAAREVLALLPVDEVVVTALDARPDSRTGHAVPIVSARIPRVMLDALNLDAIDPSDAMANFDHRMVFHPETGFAPSGRVAPFPEALHGPA